MGWVGLIEIFRKTTASAPNRLSALNRLNARNRCDRWIRRGCPNRCDRCRRCRVIRLNCHWSRYTRHDNHWSRCFLRGNRHLRHLTSAGS